MQETKKTMTEDEAVEQLVKGRQKQYREQVVKAIAAGREVDIKPNEPCPCRSGKKWKRCCLPAGRKMAESIAAELELNVALRAERRAFVIMLRTEIAIQSKVREIYQAVIPELEKLKDSKLGGEGLEKAQATIEQYKNKDIFQEILMIQSLEEGFGFGRPDGMKKLLAKQLNLGDAGA